MILPIYELIQLNVHKVVSIIRTEALRSPLIVNLELVLHNFVLFLQKLGLLDNIIQSSMEIRLLALNHRLVL